MKRSLQVALIISLVLLLITAIAVWYWQRANQTEITNSTTTTNTIITNTVTTTTNASTAKFDANDHLDEVLSDLELIDQAVNDTK